MARQRDGRGPLPPRSVPVKLNPYMQSDLGRHNVSELERMHRWTEEGFRAMVEQGKFTQPGSPLALLDGDLVLATALVPPHQTVLDGLRACQQALAMVNYFVHQGGPLNKAMFGTIMRMGTLGAAHVIYMLEPDDHDQRVERAKDLARAENFSWYRWYRDWTAPTHQGTAAQNETELTEPDHSGPIEIAEQEWVAKYQAQNASLIPPKAHLPPSTAPKQAGPPSPHDGALWDNLAAVLANSYESDFQTPNDAIRQIKALWNFGSGATHGWGWVWYSHWGNYSPDEMTAQFQILGVATHKAFTLAVERSAPSD